VNPENSMLPIGPNGDYCDMVVRVRLISPLDACSAERRAHHRLRSGSLADFVHDVKQNKYYRVPPNSPCPGSAGIAFPEIGEGRTGCPKKPGSARPGGPAGRGLQLSFEHPSGGLLVVHYGRLRHYRLYTVFDVDLLRLIPCESCCYRLRCSAL
jgi:hypothetical protein